MVETEQALFHGFGKRRFSTRPWFVQGTRCLALFAADPRSSLGSRLFLARRGFGYRALLHRPPEQRPPLQSESELQWPHLLDEQRPTLQSESELQ